MDFYIQVYFSLSFQAVAIVLGFLVFIGLIILLVFAARTRSQIRYWGVDRVLWEEPKVASAGFHNSIGEWVSVKETGSLGSPHV